jgi:hypothetical protein
MSEAEGSAIAKRRQGRDPCHGKKSSRTAIARNSKPISPICDGDEQLRTWRIDITINN